MTIRDLKIEKRKEFINKRSKVSSIVKEAINLEVNKAIAKSLGSKSKDGYIGIYWPLIGEIDLRNLKLISDLKIALPLCSKNRKMHYCPWGNKPLGRDQEGIKAPINERSLQAEEIDILLVPGIAIDKNFIRLGHGGGYFDILRENINWRKIPAFVVIPEACISNEDLPREEFDIPFDGWISELGQTKKHS